MGSSHAQGSWECGCEGRRALMRARTRPGVTLGPHLLLTHPRAGGTQRGATSPSDGSPSHAPPANCSPSDSRRCLDAPLLPPFLPGALKASRRFAPCGLAPAGSGAPSAVPDFCLGLTCEEPFPELPQSPSPNYPRWWSSCFKPCRAWAQGGRQVLLLYQPPHWHLVVFSCAG